MHTLYTAGYQNIKTNQHLLATAKRLGAVVADVRFSPKSKFEQWRGGVLLNLLGEQGYIHVGELGNRNYKGGPIDLVDIDGGTQRISNMLTAGSVILLCVCRNLDTCHRLLAAEEITKRLGCEVVHLGRADFTEIETTPTDPVSDDCAQLPPS